MPGRRDGTYRVSLWLVAGLFGCNGVIGSAEGPGGGASSNSGRPGTGPGSRGTGSSVSCTAGQIDPGPTFLRRLTNQEYQETAALLLGDGVDPVSADFPPDLSAKGFSNNSESIPISSLHVERYQQAAEQLAMQVVSDPARRAKVIGCDPASGGVTCLTSFITSFGQRMFRRPLRPEESQAFLALAQQASADPDPLAGARLVIEAALQSPSFLFRVEEGSPDPARPDRIKLSGFEIATRLSMLLLGHAPSDALLAAAAGGKLDTPDGISSQAESMIATGAAASAVRSFYTQWLHLQQLDGVQRDATKNPGWSEDLRAAMKEETTRFVEDFLWNKDADVLDLLSAKQTFVNSTMGKFYGVAASGDWSKVALPATRVGLLTQASILTITAKNEAATMIQRGKYVRDAVLCDPTPPPPPNVPPLMTETGTSAQDQLNQHLKDPVCASCHKNLDPLGKGFARFDAIGAYRTTDANGVAIAQAGVLNGFDNPDFDGPIELASRLRQAPEVPACMVKQLFRYTFGRSEIEVDQCTLAALGAAFDGSKHSFEKLLVAVVGSEAFRYRSKTDPQDY